MTRPLDNGFLSIAVMELKLARIGELQQLCELIGCSSQLLSFVS